MVGFCHLTDYHHGQKPTMVGICHGGKMPVGHYNICSGSHNDYQYHYYQYILVFIHIVRKTIMTRSGKDSWGPGAICTGSFIDNCIGALLSIGWGQFYLKRQAKIYFQEGSDLNLTCTALSTPEPPDRVRDIHLFCICLNTLIC